MKRLVILALFAAVICTGCEKDVEGLESSFINGLNFSNYPRIDCSTSALPLNMLIACELLGVNHRWEYDFKEGVWGIEPKLKNHNSAKFKKLIRSSSTHQSFINLIDKKEDLILVARKMSEDEKAHADAAGVSLIETPIALDAFVFIVHHSNPVQALTIEQIQDIYTAKTRNWKYVGGNDAVIKPFVRNANSGSQELMESLVMKDLGMSSYFEVYDDLTEYVIRNMTGAFIAVSNDMNPNAICYSIHYYKEHIIRTKKTKSIAVNGILPNKENIGNGTYPFIEPVYAVIRSDLDKSSMAYKVYQWLQTEEGKKAINASGYLTY